MNKESLDFEVNNICEAFGCSQKATAKINVKVGQLGSIPLNLCVDCVKKFDVKETQLSQSFQEEFPND